MTPDSMRTAIATAMGWSHIHDALICRPWKNLDTGELADEAPNYPTDANAALQFADWLAGSGYLWRAMSGTSGIRVSVFKIGWIKSGEFHEATAPTLPLAICESGLRALNLYIETP